MKIFLKLIKTISLDVNSTDTIEEIKENIHAIEGSGMPMLFLDGQHLGDTTRTLADYNIEEFSTIEVHIEDGMKISIKLPDGRTITIRASSEDNIRKLKSMIHEKESIVPEQHVLFFSGRVLEDHQILKSCNIGHDSVLQLVLRPIIMDDLHIGIKMSNDKIIPLYVKTWFTVKDVKKVFETMEGVPADYTMFLYDGKSLEDERRMSEYNIADGSIIQVSSQVQIFVKSTGHEKTVTLIVFEHNSIKEVLQKIGEKMCCKLENHALHHSGRELDKNKTIRECNVVSESTLNLHDGMRMSTLRYGAIFINTRKSEDLSLNFSRETTVGDVKNIIREMLKTEIGRLRLYTNCGIELCQDSRLVVDYGIRPGDVLLLIRSD